MKTKMIVILFAAFVLVACTADSGDKTGTGTPGPACTTCEPDRTAGEAAATPSAGMVATHELTMQFAKPESPYPDGTKGTFVIGADNTLKVTINGVCTLIKNPVVRAASSVEFIFKDNCSKNVEYQASATPSGTLNEINIGPVGGGYFGQFHQ